jgi:hypothetical protein
MTQLAAKIASVPIPKRMRHLPLSERGYPVPRFVEWIDGQPDFRVMSSHHMLACIKKKVCWVCGDYLGQYKAFVIGPMCAVNRTSAEPPSHLECATYSAVACPFLTNPMEKRDRKDMPGNAVPPGGVMLPHNPGVTLVWVTTSYSVIRDGKGKVLFRIGDANEVSFLKQGRAATREEVLASINIGLPILRQMAEEQDREVMTKTRRACNQSREQLEHTLAAAMRLLPQES